MKKNKVFSFFIKKIFSIFKREKKDILYKYTKDVSLFNRFKVYLENEYLNLIIEPNTCCTDEEFKNADEWANKTTKYLLILLSEWVSDGKPDEKLYTKKDLKKWIRFREKNKNNFNKINR